MGDNTKLGEIPDAIIIYRLQEGGCASIRWCACIWISTVHTLSCAMVRYKICKYKLKCI